MQNVFGLKENSPIATRQLSCWHAGVLLVIAAAAAAIEASAASPEKNNSVRIMIYRRNE